MYSRVRGVGALALTVITILSFILPGGPIQADGGTGTVPPPDSSANGTLAPLPDDTSEVVAESNPEGEDYIWLILKTAVRFLM